MKRQKYLNDATIEKASKESEKIKKLEEKIQKSQMEINKIKHENSWMRYLDSNFCDNATEDQQIEFFNKLTNIYK